MIFFRLLSRLPLAILYRLADVLYFLLTHVIRYRRRVILDNLRHSFPDRSPAELRQLARGFYRNLSDVIVEIIRLGAMPAEEMRRRLVYTNPADVRQLIDAGQSVLVMASHQSNWEWIPPAAVLNGIPADSVYKPLANPFFEELVRGIRSRYGAYVFPMNRLPRELAQRRKQARVLGLVADQIPDQPEFAYWTDFLHRDTPFYPGTERLARSLNWPVFYVDLVRIRRGYYEATFRPIAQPPYDTLPPGAMLERYRDLLENTINRQPANWLWSHKRWKHTRDQYGDRLAVKLT